MALRQGKRVIMHEQLALERKDVYVKKWPFGVAGSSLYFICLEGRLCMVDTTNSRRNPGHHRNKFGNIEVRFFLKRPPNMWRILLPLAQSGFLDKTIFHRVITGFMIQGGDLIQKARTRQRMAWGIHNRVKAEFNAMPQVRGIGPWHVLRTRIAPARSFLCVCGGQILDGKYTVFGEVVQAWTWRTKVCRSNVTAVITPWNALRYRKNVEK